MTTQRLYAPAHPDALGAPTDVSVDAHPMAAEAVERVVDDEIARLSRIFAPWDPDSEFSRWRRGSVDDQPVSPELAQVLAASERFWVFSKGSFHPASEPLVLRWLQAEADGVEPTASEMKSLAEGLELPYTAVNGPLRRTGDCSRVDLTPIARGQVLDAATQVGWRLGLASAIVVSAGGTLRHRGAGGVRVDLRASGQLTIRDAALSVWTRPEVPVRAQWSRCLDVIDPRTGWPADDITSVAALATDALTACALAAIVRVGGASSRGVLPGTAWTAVHADGRVTASDNWPLIGGSAAA